MNSSAEFSDCGEFRHRLDRWWGVGPRVLFLMANPSKAGADENDPTVLRVCHFSKYWGYDGATVLNREPKIATDPKELNKWRDGFSWNNPKEYKKIQDTNLALIRDLSSGDSLRIVAWGNLVENDSGTQRTLVAFSLDLERPLFCMGATKSGAPKHPMARGRNRIPNDQQPILWQRQTGDEP